MHGLDGRDEISLTGDSKLISKEGEKYCQPQLAGLEVKPEAIAGGNTVEEAADIFKTIIEGSGTPEQEAVVLANAAVALHVTGAFKNYEDAFAAAKESLKAGKAKACLQKLISLQ